MKTKILLIILFLASYSYAQENLTYQKPPKEILDLADANLAPGVQIDSKGEHIVLIYSNQYKSIAELSETELRLAGLRINPVTNIGSRTTFYTNLKVKKTGEKDAKQVTGLTENPRLPDFTWSPDESMMACLNTTETGVEVWIININEGVATKVTSANINANMGSTLNWFKDNNHLLIKTLAANRKALINTATAIPNGPTVSVSDGSKAQNRTYQDLLKTPNDELNFEQLVSSEIKKVSINGEIENFLPSDMYEEISFSPDGNFVMITKIKRPFSYLVTYSSFPSESTVYNLNGTIVKTVNQVPLDEVRPKGFMATRTGKRNMSWRSDKPATLVWAEALDSGDPEIKVKYRDAVYELNAPFNSNPKLILKTLQRFTGIQWGNDNIAIATDNWWNTRNTKTYLFNPSDANSEAKVISDRSYQDVYSNPGKFVTSKNEFGKNTLDI